MTPEVLSAIRYATCAIGWIGTTSEEFYADPKRAGFDIEGTGFLVGPQQVATCAHVVESLQVIRQRQGLRPFAWGVQFVYPSASGAGDMTTAFRSFAVAHSDERIDIAILKLDGKPIAPSPLSVVPHDFIPAVGEAVGLCGYAHGSVLLRRGKAIYRFGPVVQAGAIAALSSFDLAKPEAAILDLVTGPAASGSPIFRQATGEVLGLLVEGQIGQRAALSVARLVYRDPSSALTAGVVTFEATRVDRVDGT